MKLFLTLRQWLTDLKELQVAGSLPSKETVMQSLKTVVAPSDPGKLYSAIERKAAGWVVMDADTRLSDSTAGAGKGAKGDHRGAYSATTPYKHHAKGTCARVQILTQKVRTRSPATRAAKARKRTTREIGARTVEKSRIRHIGQNRVRRLLLLCKLC